MLHFDIIQLNLTDLFSMSTVIVIPKHFNQVKRFIMTELYQKTVIRVSDYT